MRNGLELLNLIIADVLDTMQQLFDLVMLQYGYLPYHFLLFTLLFISIFLWEMFVLLF
jgi:hypothetical protein